MYISLTKREAAALTNIMNSAESSSSNELKELLKDNKIISYTIDNAGVGIEINPEYMEEFLSVYEKYIDLFVYQAKALYKSVCLFQEDTEKIINKYLNTETNTPQEVEDSWGE